MSAWKPFCCLAGVLIWFAAGALAQTADYGDLPDPTYPTAFASSGPFHLDTSHEWIGTTSISLTTVEASPKMPDLDEDDGFVTLDNLYSDGTFQGLGVVRVPITTDATTDTRYLNVVADLNGDGQFRSYMAGGKLQYEWLVCNRPIVFEGETKIVSSLCCLISPVVSVNARRATLSTYPLMPLSYGDDGWDGTGPGIGFARGETEDFLDPYYCLDEEWFPDGMGLTFYPPDPDEPTTFSPLNPPTQGQPIVDGPGKWNGGGGGNGKKPPDHTVPARPALPHNRPPSAPVVTYPPGFNINEPVVEKGSVKGVPDIKQGPNECVPTAAANSIRYLMNQEGMDGAAISEGYAESSAALNKKLVEELKKAMKTNQDKDGNPDNSGTDVCPKGKNDGFREGKKNAKLPSAMQTAGGENNISTTAIPNPSIQQIKEAIDKGYDVEINFAFYGSDNKRKPEGHMVTVTGYAVHADGTVQLFYHDPGVKQNGDQAGVAANPPRQQSIIVTNGTGEEGKGGLAVYGGGPAKEGETAVINGAYIEKLTTPQSTGASVDSDAPGPMPTGSAANLHANHVHATPLRQAGEEQFTGYFYQWLHNGNLIQSAHEPDLVLDNLTTLDSGQYACWIFDFDNQLYEQTPPITLTVFPAEPSRADHWMLME